MLLPGCEKSLTTYLDSSLKQCQKDKYHVTTPTIVKHKTHNKNVIIKV